MGDVRNHRPRVYQSLEKLDRINELLPRRSKFDHRVNLLRYSRRARYQANLRGEHNEILVYEALSDSRLLPDWVRAVTESDDIEEGRGIDFRLWLDIGSLKIQVKSSHRDVEEFYGKYGHHFIMVIVRPESTAESIRADVIRQATTLRERIRGWRRRA